jgi:phosphonate transport system substrate-binding protein
LTNRHRLLTSLVAACLLGACGGGSSSSTGQPAEEQPKDQLTMAFVPSQQAQQVQVSADQIAEYLTKQTGIKIVSRVLTSYAAVTEGMTSGNVDIGWVGPLDYVIGHEQNGAEAMTKSVRKGKAGYVAFIIARKGSGINGIKDLKGHSFAFGDPISASSNLYPRYFMKKNGINPDKDLTKTVNIANQTAIATAVCSGNVDAGAIYDDARTNKGANDACPGIMDRTQVVFTTPLIPGDPQEVRKNLNSGQKKKVRDAFAKLGNDPEMQKILLSLYTIEKLVPAGDSDYTEIRNIVREVNPGLLKGSSATTTSTSSTSASVSTSS